MEGKGKSDEQSNELESELDQSMEEKEKSGEQSSESEDKLDQSKEKPNWFICFFKVLAAYFSGFIGKDLTTGEKVQNRFLSFVNNVFVLIMRSLPVALFVSYFLITLPTWLFVLAIVQMAFHLFMLVYQTNEIKKIPSQSQEQKKTEEQAKNHAKFYIYGQKYYKNKPTTLIGDFFRLIGTMYFSGFVGKNFLFGENIYCSTKWQLVRMNISSIIFDILFWITVVSCFLITVPKWLFVLAIVAAGLKFVDRFYCAYIIRQKNRRDIYFCRCGEKSQAEWYTSLRQVNEENRYGGVPNCEFIDVSEVDVCPSCCELPNSKN